jgi:hypothetical protein
MEAKSHALVITSKSLAHWFSCAAVVPECGANAAALHVAT